jgi:hypothetical protein
MSTLERKPKIINSIKNKININYNTINKFQFKKVNNNNDDDFYDNFGDFLIKIYNKNIVIKIKKILNDFTKFIVNPKSKNGSIFKKKLIKEIYTIFHKIIIKTDYKYYTSGLDYQLNYYIHKAKYADVYSYNNKVVKRIKIGEHSNELFTLFFESLMHSYLYYLNNEYVTKIYYASLSSNKVFGNIISEKRETTFDDFLHNTNFKNLNISGKYYYILLISIKLAEIILFYQNKCNFIHGDLKNNNFMVFFDKDRNCKVKLIDFGFSGLYMVFDTKKYYITNPDCYHLPNMYNLDLVKNNSRQILDLLFYTLVMILNNDMYNIEDSIVNRLVLLLNITNFNDIRNIYNNDSIDYIYKYVRITKLNQLEYYNNFIPKNYIQILENEKIKILKYIEKHTSELYT